MSYLTFLKPVMLWLLVIIPIAYAFYQAALKKRRRAAAKFSSLGLIKQAAKKKHNIRDNLNLYLTLAVLALMVLGFADPHIPLEQTKEGVNVVLALDVSGSMQATDYPPNRLEAAKSAAKTLLESLEPQDHAGVVVFESGATTSAYLSPFKDRVIDKLQGIAPRQGRTAIGDGLSLAIDMASSIPNKKKVVILLSDGVNNAGVIAPQEAIAFAKAQEIQVNTIGMGSEGKVVLGYDFFGNPQYAELDEATLKAIAAQTDGEYFKSVDSGTLNEIYERIGENLEREKEPTSIKDWLFAIALLIVLLQFYMAYGKYRIIQ